MLSKNSYKNSDELVACNVPLNSVFYCSQSPPANRNSQARHKERHITFLVGNFVALNDETQGAMNLRFRFFSTLRCVNFVRFIIRPTQYTRSVVAYGLDWFLVWCDVKSWKARAQNQK